MLSGHHAAVGAAATSAIGNSVELPKQASLNGVDVHEELLLTVARDANAQAYVATYLNYVAASDGRARGHPAGALSTPRE
ncbi:hypothetical protein [Arthrobacter livingstonensis]|uniref:hypothetical protein n=1 Tax=Arthrobacter livingstonensis TaxID=670078 RepID=UPI002482D556|nr:hypothetical protein [Arthrobacter livingstonensis]